MISKPADVGFDDNWDGTSVDPNTDIEHDNLESKMDWKEHQRIVFDARTLIAGNIAHNTPAVKTLFDNLKTAYNDNSGEWTVYVSKGIHQPFNNPHLQLVVKRRYRNDDKQWINERKRYHLNVSAEALAERNDSFQWTPKQFTVEHDNAFYKWPANASIKLKSGAKKRRNSLSAADLASFIEAQEAAKVAAEKAKLHAAQKAAAGLKAKDFASVWEQFKIDNKITKDPKYSKDQSTGFKKGTTVLHIAGPLGKYHVKYFPDEGAILKTNSQGARA